MIENVSSVFFLFRRHFRPLNDIFDLAIQRCEKELDRNQSLIDHDILYMCCAVYRQAKIPLKLRLNKRLHKLIENFTPHEISILFQHVNPDTCNDLDLLAKIHEKLKQISLNDDES